MCTSVKEFGNSERRVKGINLDNLLNTSEPPQPSAYVETSNYFVADQF